MHKGRVVFGAMDEVVFGRPAADAIVAQTDRLRASRAFLMVSGTLNRQTDEIDKIRRALGPRYAGIFDAMPPHTPREAVIAAANQARAADADLIITVGGGSITDGAKAVQLCLANDVGTVDGIDLVRAVRGIAPPMTAPRVNQISVPTTIAGGEFSAIAGVTNTATHVKEMLRHELAMPRAVILDPAITVHTPEWLWLSTGIRAVDHAVETYCSIDGNAYTDSTALQALRLLGRGLPAVKRDPAESAARLDCQIGAWISMTGIVGGTRIGGKPRHRTCAGRQRRGAARLHLLRHAAGRAGVQFSGQCRSPGRDQRRARRGRPAGRRGARPLHRRAWPAAAVARRRRQARGSAAHRHELHARRLDLFQPAAHSRGAGNRAYSRSGVLRAPLPSAPSEARLGGEAG